jgi:hypothetical protein
MGLLIEPLIEPLTESYSVLHTPYSTVAKQKNLYCSKIHEQSSNSNANTLEQHRRAAFFDEAEKIFAKIAPAQEYCR